MIRKKIVELRAKRKKARAEAKKIMKKLVPLIEKGIKVYLAQKYGIKI